MKFSFSVAAEQNALIALSDQASAFDSTDVLQIRKYIGIIGARN